MSGWVRCLAVDALAHKLIFRRGLRAWLALSVRPRGANMRRQSVQVPRHIGAWIAKWLFVVAALTMPIVFGAASGHAQDFANQPQVQAAIQEVVDATKEAVANIPASDAIKKAEDALDAAIRNNEDISDQPHADNEKENERREKKRNAKEAQNKAETAAEDARAKAADAERTRATNYREALAKGVPPERSCRPRSLQCVTRLREPGPPFSELGRTG